MPAIRDAYQGGAYFNEYDCGIHCNPAITYVQL
jgi:hypothetical protein